MCCVCARWWRCIEVGGSRFCCDLSTPAGVGMPRLPWGDQRGECAVRDCGRGHGSLAATPDPGHPRGAAAREFIQPAREALGAGILTPAPASDCGTVKSQGLGLAAWFQGRPMTHKLEFNNRDFKRTAQWR